MTKRYFLVCDSCKNRIPIETSQAGRTIKCIRCSESIKLGTLRDIRALEPESSPQAVEARQETKVWSQGRRISFVIGLVLLVFCGLIGGFSLLKAASIWTERPATQTNDAFRNRVASDSPATMLANWEQVDISTIESWVEHPYLTSRKEVQILRIWGWGGMIGAAIGTCAIAWSFIKRDGPVSRV